MRELYTVQAITRDECSEFVLNIHYAGRWPSISYAFGLFEQGVLVGIVTYGCPLSSTLRTGLAGKEFAPDVLELNRLCLRNNKPNEASLLVGRSLKLLPKGKIIISFADTSQGHSGYVYQACNFTYHGLSAKRTDWAVKGKEHLHGQTISDMVRGAESRVQALRDMFGDDFYLKPRPRKHRYVYVVGSKTYKKKVYRHLKYKQEEYPKGG